MTRPADDRGKAPYVAPSLARHGDFAAITRGYVGNGAERGSGGTAMKKNTPGKDQH